MKTRFLRLLTASGAVQSVSRAGSLTVPAGQAIVALVALALIGCASGDGRGRTGGDQVVICGADGCAERPRTYAAPQPTASPEEEEAQRRLAALKQMAAQDPRAAYDLGLRFFRGDGVRQSSHDALLWMRDAAERGELEAQKALGRFYLTGLEEMGADPQEAERWLTIAAGRGDEESRQLLAEATAAKRSDQALYEWRSRWRPVFYRYWYHDYRYRTYWRNGYWVYY